MDLIGIDVESFYAQDFSLSKLTNEEYIRDPRFETIGVGIKVNAGKTRWYSGTQEYLKQIFIRYEIEKHAVLSHHAHFDMAILNWHFGIRPKIILDTLSMARGVHGVGGGNSLAALAERYNLGHKGTEIINAKGKRRIDFTTQELARYGEYCCNDVDLTYALFKCLRPHYSNAELKIIDLTVRMFTEPVLEVDVPLLDQHLIDIRFKKAQLLADAGVDKSILMSNPKFAELLCDHGMDPPMKISKTTGKKAYAFAKTDDGFKALLEHDNEQIQAFAAARVGNKSTLNETRTQRFIDIGRRGLIPVPLQYYGGHTGRWSGTDSVNLQNLPSRGRGVNTLKRSLMAPDGYVLVDSDASQIEARILAWFAGQEDLVEGFRAKKDVYRGMASKIYGIPADEIQNPSLERDLGKEAVLGCGFGMAEKRFDIALRTKNIIIPMEECTRIVRVYRETNPKITQLWKRGNDVLWALYRGQTVSFGNGCVVVDKKGIRLPSGLHIQYPNLRRIVNDEGRGQFIYNKGRKIEKVSGNLVVENVVQALANCLLKRQAPLIAKRYRWVLTVHDSLVSLVPETEIEEGMEYVRQCMTFVPEWAEGVPLDCTVKYAKRYGDY